MVPDSMQMRMSQMNPHPRMHSSRHSSCMSATISRPDLKERRFLPSASSSVFFAKRGTPGGPFGSTWLGNNGIMHANGGGGTRESEGQGKEEEL